jgi:phytol kinase
VSVPLQLSLVVASVALLVAMMAAVKFLGRRYAWSAELQRKCVHVATGVYALTLPLTFPEPWPVFVLVVLAVAVMLVLRLPRFAEGGIGSAVHGVARKSYGELLLALSVGFIFYFSIDKPVLFVLPIMVLTLSDAAAAMIGTRYGRRFFAVEAGQKSLEGVTMFFLVTWIVAMVVLLLMTDIGRLNVVLLSLIVAAFGALVEADSWRGFDNLFVPVGIHLFLARHLDTPPLQLLLLVGGFVIVLLAILALARKFSLSGHAARAYTIVVFLICVVTAAHNAMLPVAAVLAYIVAYRIRPCRSPYPDLDLIGVIAGVALLWLFLGEYLQRNTLNVYNLTFAGATLVFLTISSGRRVAMPVIAAAILSGAVLAIAGWNPDHTQWHGTLWPWIAASFALCLCVPFIWPAIFNRYRSPRALALALPVPLVLFLSRSFLP